MSQTTLTAVGRVATPITVRRFGDGAAKASFRIACNERRRDWDNGGRWVDGETLYMTVQCWRGLAENVQASLRVGDPIVVRGRMHTREFTSEGRRITVVEMDASTIGPDLAGCTAAVTRTRSTRPAAEAVEGPGQRPTPEHAPDPGEPAASQWQAGPLVEPAADTAHRGADPRPERDLVAAGSGAVGGAEAAVGP